MRITRFLYLYGYNLLCGKLEVQERSFNTVVTLYKAGVIVPLLTDSLTQINYFILLPIPEIKYELT